MTSFYLFECPFHCSGDFFVLAGVNKNWHGSASFIGGAIKSSYRSASFIAGAIESSYGAISNAYSSNKYGYGENPLIFGAFEF